MQYLFRDLHEVEKKLFEFVPAVGKYTGKDVTVDRMWKLLEKLDNPQEKLRVIHIAGTSGKTSTSYFIAQLLQTTGATVGLTVSPHVSSITERLQINGVPIDDDRFCNLYSRAFTMLDDAIDDASFFEVMIAIILWAFVELGVDYAVVETGLGGLHDSTNVCRRADKVCIITDIGFDHQSILGNTLAEIAAQKVGIVHENNHMFTYQQSSEIMAVFNEKIQKTTGSQLHICEKQNSGNSRVPLYQQHNWSLSKQVFDYISKRDSLPSVPDELLEETQYIQVPGRMEILSQSDKTYILDGAHNTQKMVAFIDSFKDKYPNTKVQILLAMKYDKEFSQVIDLLVPIAKKFICSSFETIQDLPIVSVPAQDLAAYIKSSYSIPVVEIPDYSEALRVVRQSNEPLTILTGSFYVLGDARRFLSE